MKLIFSQQLTQATQTVPELQRILVVQMLKNLNVDQKYLQKRL